MNILEIIFLLFGIIQSTLIPYYLLKIYNNKLLNIIIIVINIYLLFMLLFMYCYKTFIMYTKIKNKFLRKYNYLFRNIYYFALNDAKILYIYLFLLIIYFGILLNIYVKHDFDSKKFSDNEYYLTRIISFSLFLFIIILILTYLYVILSHRHG